MTKTPFEMMMDQANEMAKAMAPALETFSPKGFEAMWPTMSKEMMEATFGKGLNENGLDAKTRLLLTLAGLTMQGAQGEAQIRLTVRHLNEAGATDEEIAETIAMMAMFAGLPAMTRAMEIAKDVMDKHEDDET
ncbi:MULTISPECIES: carboxymuconolactone decarboxylase family protein [Lentibacter]|jgi:4-carboxymuconolactone decarboxylase|uniref:4-carboxymuconolactone decarboxylase n=1 Tax=Lentibacter algarum TaxID=576131 RepID=A0A1H3IFZ4_9RHOB|nr:MULTISPECIES: carboxymuconolactone decarboxylase family protein [Lentibacter]MCH9825298.1 carboxymuconolactone decarboxylase family protein [Alphaproteobacteria bacterium]MCO4777824.1 carboxymuconolactone decarboxylase family protein [Lentibacter algarum]MCO4828829.1 carboxymuconolactone decarboxylase family protein [Lentibacter algarum]MDG1289997.1 carboxymuconolactone decarboxylase family protein [Lentibacter sp.]WIF31464.1 gamma-carboxymuconolactone decarboxylase subunit-like protein [Le